LEQGQFPAYCPACRADAGGKDIKAGRIEGPALTFLEKRGVISKDLQYRFMKQQRRGVEEFFRCPANCGNYLKHKDPEWKNLIVPGKAGPISRRIQAPGKCPCGVMVCLRCHLQLDRKDFLSHDCGLDKMNPMDAKTLAKMNQLGKRCPNCNNFIEKTGGCNVMMCGTHAHGALLTAIKNGGCGHQFYWDSGQPASGAYTGIDGKRKNGFISPQERMEAMQKLGKVEKKEGNTKKKDAK